jgi:hypothetical protein
MLVSGILDRDIGMMPLAKVTDMMVVPQSAARRALNYAEFIVRRAGHRAVAGETHGTYLPDFSVLRRKATAAGHVPFSSAILTPALP